jgi:hypothetical protein
MYTQSKRNHNLKRKKRKKMYMSHGWAQGAKLLFHIVTAVQFIKQDA